MPIGSKKGFLQTSNNAKELVVRKTDKTLFVDQEESKPRILVVDDDVDALQSMSEILQAEGFDTICAKDGQEAWELMHRTPFPDLIIGSDAAEDGWLDLSNASASGSGTRRDSRGDC